jgi:hypothetical protein
VVQTISPQVWILARTECNASSSSWTTRWASNSSLGRARQERRTSSVVLARNLPFSQQPKRFQSSQSHISGDKYTCSDQFQLWVKIRVIESKRFSWEIGGWVSYLVIWATPESKQLLMACRERIVSMCYNPLLNSEGDEIKGLVQAKRGFRPSGEEEERWGLLDSMSHGIFRNVIACLCIWELKMLEWGLCFGVKKKMRARGEFVLLILPVKEKNESLVLFLVLSRIIVGPIASFVQLLLVALSHSRILLIKICWNFISIHTSNYYY